MAAYNGVNGHTMTESPLLADVLKGEWGFINLAGEYDHDGQSSRGATRNGTIAYEPSA